MTDLLLLWKNLTGKKRGNQFIFYKTVPRLKKILIWKKNVMNKINFITIIAITFIICNYTYAWGEKPGHITNFNLQAYPSTPYTKSTQNVYFINNYLQLCSMNNGRWNGHVIVPQNSTLSYVNPNADIMWADNKLFYVNNSTLRLEYYYFTNGIWYKGLTNSYTSGTTGLAESTNHVFYIDANGKVRLTSKSNYNSNSIINNNAPTARSSSSLIWKDERLYYISASNQIVYLSWNSTQGWYYSITQAQHVNTNSNITSSSNNLYYFDSNRNIRVYSISNNSPATVIISSAPKVNTQSKKIRWIDNRLFYTSDDGYVTYIVWERIQNWEYTKMIKAFQQDVVMESDGVTRKWCVPNTNTDFFEVENKQVLFTENQGNRIYYFRSPINLQNTLNSQNKSGWTLVSSLSDEFNTTSLNTSKWRRDYGYQNHPVEPSGFSLYYNETDLSSHFFYESSGQDVLALESTDDGAPYSVYVQSWDDNDGDYQYKSAMIHSYSAINEGFFEIRAKTAYTDQEKYCFWLFGGGSTGTIDAYEIDIFEINGDGLTSPTNYHEYPDDPLEPVTDMPFNIYPLCSQRFLDDFYTYGLEWDENKIVWYINNEIVRTIYKDQNYPVVDFPDVLLNVIVQPRIWTIQNEASQLVFPNYYEVDYVRVYQKGGKINSTNSVVNNEALNDNVLVYPIPSEGTVYFTSSDENIQSLKILNSYGGTVKTFSDINNDTFSADLSVLSSGIYYAQLKLTNSLVTKKIIVN